MIVKLRRNNEIKKRNEERNGLYNVKEYEEEDQERNYR
jgi:hypothetical protein